MLPASKVLTRVPRLPAALGTVMERNPPVTVTVALVVPEVSAEAGSEPPITSIPTTAATARLRVLIDIPVLLSISSPLAWKL
jgi:hypothetical protein